MYLAVGAVIAGQALLLSSYAFGVYLALFCAAVATFVHGYEEPVLDATFGEEYEAYRRAVPAWRPRLRPWLGTRVEEPPAPARSGYPRAQ